MGRYKQPYSLFKRGKYWYYRTYTPDGTRTTAKTTGCSSKSAAKDYCNKLYLTGGLWGSDKTFGEYAIHFYDDNSIYVKDRYTPLSDNTLRSYRIRFKENIYPYFKDIKLCDINYTKLKEFRLSLINQKYKPSVIISTMSVLKHIIESAYKDRLIPVNPFDFLDPLNAPKAERDAFTLEETIFIYKNIGDEFKNTILLMALTGMRISEAVGVTLDDIQKSNDFEYINLQKQFNNKKYVVLKGKRARPIPIIPEIKELIGFNHLRLSAFYRVFEPLKNQCNNYEERLLCFHSLRHFFITNSKADNVNDVKVEFIAGHSLKGIKKVYTNFKAEDLQDILPWQKKIYDLITK